MSHAGWSGQRDKAISTEPLESSPPSWPRGLQRPRTFSTKQGQTTRSTMCHGMHLRAIENVDTTWFKHDLLKAHYSKGILVFVLSNASVIGWWRVHCLVLDDERYSRQPPEVWRSISRLFNELLFMDYWMGWFHLLLWRGLHANIINAENLWILWVELHTMAAKSTCICLLKHKGALIGFQVL